MSGATARIPRPMEEAGIVWEKTAAQALNAPYRKIHQGNNNFFPLKKNAVRREVLLFEKMLGRRKGHG